MVSNGSRPNSPVFGGCWGNDRLKAQHQLVIERQFFEELACQEVMQPDAQNLDGPKKHKDDEKLTRL